MSKLLACYS